MIYCICPGKSSVGKGGGQDCPRLWPVKCLNHPGVRGWGRILQGMLTLTSTGTDRWLSSVQSLSHVQLFATPWTAARQASLSITNSWSLLILMSIESVIPSKLVEKNSREEADHASYGLPVFLELPFSRIQRTQLHWLLQYQWAGMVLFHLDRNQTFLWAKFLSRNKVLKAMPVRVPFSLLLLPSPRTLDWVSNNFLFCCILPWSWELYSFIGLKCLKNSDT